MAQISKSQPMRPAEIELVEQVNENTTNVATLTAGLANEITDRTNADTTLQNNIDSERNARVAADNTLTTNLASVPSIQYGTSNSVDVTGNSSTDVTVSFGMTKTEAPVVICGLQHSSGNLTCVVTQVTNLEFAARIFNLSNTDVTGVTLDYIALSGR